MAVETANLANGGTTATRKLESAKRATATRAVFTIHLPAMPGLVSVNASPESVDNTVTDVSEASMELHLIVNHAGSVSTAGTELLENLSTRPRVFLLLLIISETMALQEWIEITS